MKWINVTERLPEIVDKKTMPRFVKAEIKKYGGGTYLSKRVAYYFYEHTKSVEWEDWDDYSEEDFPYTENDCDKGIVWLRPGWYELVNCESCEEHWNRPLNVVEWLDESPVQKDEAREAVEELAVNYADSIHLCDIDWNSESEKAEYLLKHPSQLNELYGMTIAAFKAGYAAKNSKP
jgi:hypothetical protein